MSNYERGRKLLRFLGTPVQRAKQVPVEQSSNGVCRDCHAVIVWSTTATGKRMPFDPNPQGEWVIVARNAVSFGPAYEGLRRYSPHYTSCRQNSSNKERPQ